MAIFLAIFLVLMIAYAVIIEGYRTAWNQIPVFQSSTSIPASHVSVVIALRNESLNVDNLLDCLSAQNYPDHLVEFILVDDFSTDNTADKIRQYKGKAASQLVFVSLQEEFGSETNIQSHKKRAIEAGIKKSKGTIIVTTDADCRFGPDWLGVLISFYEKNQARFVAAPVKISPAHGFLSIFQALDFMSLQGITGAVVSTNKMTMCNGANLVYSKLAFTEVNGFQGIDDIPSGDDMLLMYKIYQRFPNQVFYLKDSSVIVETDPVKTWRGFFQQRIRWASKADRYDDKRIFKVLLLVYAINLCYLILGISSFFNSTWLFFFLLLLLAKTLIEFPFVNAVSSFFQQQSLMKYFVFLQPIHILYTIIAGWLGKFGSFEWKGRVIKTNSLKDARG
jgi:cellulose synthase/poly-beta-1,6-N-acetylglucosamine synthase-like glycosyltransferase